MRLEDDKLKHAVACAVTAAVGALLMVALRQPWYGAMTAGMLCAVCIGVGKEFGDMQSPTGTWDWRDIAADAIGGVIGSTAGLLALVIN